MCTPALSKRASRDNAVSKTAFGSYLLFRREQLGLTLAKLTEQTGIKPRRLGALQDAGVKPEPLEVFRLAAALGVSEVFLLTKLGVIRTWHF